MRLAKLRWMLLLLAAAAITATIVFAILRTKERRALQDRLEASLGVHRTAGEPMAGSEYAWQLRKRLLDALSRADVESLRSPHVAVGAEYKEPNQFMVQWLEDEPTPDSVQLLSDNGDVVWTARISEADQRFNRDHIETSVVFTAMFSIPADDPIVTKIADSPLQVVLLKDGKRVSAPTDVLRINDEANR